MLKKQSTKEKTPNLAVIPKDLASLNFFLNSQIQQKSFLISHILFTISLLFRKPFTLHSKSAVLLTLCSSTKSKCPIKYSNGSQQNLTMPETFIFL